MKQKVLTVLGLMCATSAFAADARKIECEVNHHYDVVIAEDPATKNILLSSITSADESERPTPFYSLPATDKVTIVDIGDAIKNGESLALHGLRIDKNTGRPGATAQVMTILIGVPVQDGNRVRSYVSENGRPQEILRSCNVLGTQVILEER